MIKKSTRILLSVALVVLMTVGTVFQTYAAPEWYRVETQLVYVNGKLKIKSECTDQVDDDCNMPGSVHYIDVPSFLTF